MGQVAEIIFKDIEENKDVESLIEKVLQTCFKVEGISPLQFYICVTLTNPENIHAINKEFRKVDRPTDVLSFPMFEGDELKNMLSQKQDNLPEGLQDILGDIIISIEQIKVQAKEYGHSFERELSYMAVHGFYHLMGYDHMEEEEKKVMRKKEEAVLQLLDLTRE